MKLSIITPLLGHLSVIEDPRMRRTRLRNLIDMLALAICSVICGVDNWVEMEAFGNSKKKWLSTFLELPNGIPPHDTLRRVLRLRGGMLFHYRLRQARGVFHRVGS